MKRGDQRVFAATLEVVTSLPRIREERGEGAAANHVSAVLGALAVADRDDAVEIDGYLHAAAVVLAPAGLPPERVRQVGHGLPHLLCELP